MQNTRFCTAEVHNESTFSAVEGDPMKVEETTYRGDIVTDVGQDWNRKVVSMEWLHKAMKVGCGIEEKENCLHIISL